MITTDQRLYLKTYLSYTFTCFVTGVFSYAATFMLNTIAIFIYAFLLAIKTGGSPSDDTITELVTITVPLFNTIGIMVIIILFSAIIKSRKPKLPLYFCTIVGGAALTSYIVTGIQFGQAPKINGDTGFQFLCFCVYSLIGFWYSPLFVGLYSRFKQRKSRAALKPYKLTAREEEVVLEVVAGKRNKDIATTLFIEEGTVKQHLQSIFRKMGVSSRVAIIALFKDYVG